MVLCKMMYFLHIYIHNYEIYPGDTLSWGYISQTCLNYMHYTPFILSPPVPKVKVFQYIF